MCLMRRSFRPLVWLLLALNWALLLPGLAQAQTSALSSSTDALQLFQGLSSDEQQAILSRLGAGSAAGGLGMLGGSQGQLGAFSQLGQLQQGLVQRRPRREEEERPLIPTLRGGDWVIIQVGFQLAPPPAAPSPQALQQLYSAQGGGAPSAQNLQALQALQGGAVGGAAQQAPAFVPVVPVSQLTTPEKRQLRAMMQLIRSRNPYQLSPDGVLTLPGFAPIALLGLTEQQATLRLQVVPAFQSIQVRLTLLPLKETGAQALKPFGYDLFAEYPSTFEPLTNVPVPSDYIIGAGDVLDVLLYGNENHAYQMVVGRDGQVNFPDLGPIDVGGQLFSAVQAEIQARVAHQMIGVRASVTLGQSRSIQVFVMGNAYDPGSYTISALGTITSALYAAGGVRDIGSLRNIQLKRDGRVIRRLDLYDLLIHGSTADDAKLLQGDVVFIPSVGATVSIDGAVQRPAIYEMRDETSPGEAVALAGGTKPNADLSKATLTRIMPDGERVVFPLELAERSAEGLRNGDLINIPRLRPTLDLAIGLRGHVYTSGTYYYRPGMRLTDVIHSVSDLKPNADLHYVLIRRELPPDRHVVAVSADLAAALAAPGSSSDVQLMPRPDRAPDPRGSARGVDRRATGAGRHDRGPGQRPGGISARSRNESR
jgi:polysaccharide biosynthesis/export protein